MFNKTYLTEEKREEVIVPKDERKEICDKLKLKIQNLIYEIEDAGYPSISQERICYELGTENVYRNRLEDYTNKIPLEALKDIDKARKYFDYIEIYIPKPHTGYIGAVGAKKIRDYTYCYFTIAKWRV